MPREVGVRHGVTNPYKRRQECHPLDRVGLAGGPFRMVGPDGVGKRAPAHEPHRVIRRLPLAELIDRHNPRMLELRRDLGLVEKPGAECRVILLVGTQLLERDQPAQRLVASQPDLPHSPPAVELGQRVSITSLLRRQ